MALQPRRFFIDVAARQFVNSPSSNLPSSDPALFDEDVEAVEIYALRPTGDSSRPYSYVDLSSSTVKFAIGTVSPSALQTAWSALSQTVTLTVAETQAGGTLDEKQTITWSGASPASGSFAIKFPERTVSCSIAGKFFTSANHGFYNGQVIKFSSPSGASGVTAGKSYQVLNAGQSSFQVGEIGSLIAAGSDSGTGTISATIAELVTPSIAYNATISQIQAAIVAAGFVANSVPQVLVSGENGVQLELYYAGRNGQGAYPNVVIVNSSLSGAAGVSANVSLNTVEIAALVAAGTTSVTLEVEISEGAIRQSFQRSATLSRDLITSTSPSPLPAVTATSFGLQSPDGSIFTISVTNSGELMIAEE